MDYCHMFVERIYKLKMNLKESVSGIKIRISVIES